MYSYFMGVKLGQERKRVQKVEGHYISIIDTLDGNDLLDEVYLDEKTILNEMSSQCESKIDRLEIFC